MRAITGVTLIDGTGAEPMRDAALVIGDDGRIAEVGAFKRLPRGAEVIDGGGRTLMPGLIDVHVHFYSNTKTMQERALTPPTLATFEAAANARETLDAGVTTVRDAGGTPAGFKLAAERGLIAAPRMRVAVTALSQTGGHGDATMPSGVRMSRGDGPEWPENLCDGPDEVRKTVRSVLRAGADFIKLHATGGVMSPSDEPGSPQFTPEEIAVMVYEATAHGKTCMAHAQATAGIRNAVRAGVESIEHGIFLDDEVIAEMRQRGTFLVPTLHAPRGVLLRAKEHPGSVLPQSLRKTHEVIDTHVESIRAAYEAGVRIAMGTDAGVGKHGTNAQELEYLTQIGMTPMEAIVASTKTAAECVHMAKEVGTLEPGKWADLLLVDGDPLADITVLQQRERLLLIMQGGRVHRAHEDLGCA
ncbi:MAG: amidohydrolase family protein [Chloroflexi bacterium]|nr:amidohydrolase family protein [Chloroflexota bacterium]